jgi:hypothetical protein
VRAILLTSLFLLIPAAAVEAQVQPDTVPRFAGGCLDSRDGSAGMPALDFEGWRFDAMGGPEPIQVDNLDAVGALGDLTLFAGRLAERPVVDLWVPVCQPPDHYQLYTRSSSSS